MEYQTYFHGVSNVKLVFHTEIFEFLKKRILKIGLFLGQEVLQIKPNLVWSILRVGRLWDKKNGPPNFHRKKVRISIGNIDFFAFYIFKQIEIYRVKKLFKVNQTWYGVSSG